MSSQTIIIKIISYVLTDSYGRYSDSGQSEQSIEGQRKVWLGNANDHNYRSALIETFVNKIIPFDGDDPRVEIYCNASEKPLGAKLDKNNCAKDEQSKRSSLAQVAPSTRFELTTFRLGGEKSSYL